MNKRKLLVLGLFVVLIAAGYIAMRQFAGMKELPPERPKRVSTNFVRVNEVTYQEIDTEVVEYGRITSSQPLDLIAEIGGRLFAGQVQLKPGVNFRKGQLMYRINDAEARLNLQARKSQFLNLIASSLPDFKIDFTEDYPAWQKYFESIEIDKSLEPLPEITTNKVKTFLATKNILGEYYSIKSGEENLRKYYQYAPYDGSIVNVNLETGTVVNPGANIASIIRTDLLELEIPVDPKEIRWVKEGAEVQVSSEDGSQTWPGEVIRIADFIDPTTQSINVYVGVNAQPNSGLYDGQYLRATIPGSRLEQAMQIPRRVLINEDQVYVVKDGLLQARRVNIEKITQDQVVISPLEGSGLNTGDSLVVDLPANAVENMRVTTNVESSAPSGSRPRKADNQSDSVTTKNRSET
ncbi:MAG: efflux RND transporter periplasmic adaptor subunit [Tunicatimonas sp.]|uniref:efflux RND transporter periplasmic adaptor subunit n=1 Tax=Tunicatimonas sp. TaxID=1940096 RepID=UPI003C775BFE